MLVLTRKENQSIIIGDNVESIVIAVEGNRVKLGFAAPPVRVIRSELLPLISNQEFENESPETALNVGQFIPKMK